MSESTEQTPNPQLDLTLERVVDVSPEVVWKAWTQPEHIVKWFTPAPWTTTHCEIDLRPGGSFKTTMRSPEGDEFPNEGCYLEIVENEKLVWTNGLLPGFRPNAGSSDDIQFTAIITLTPEGSGTRYKVLALHKDEDGKGKHEAMGFEHGWGAALDQLVAYMKSI